jgi:hypothetical protein
MGTLSSLIEYFKEVSKSIKFQLSAALSFGCGLVALWVGKGKTEVALIVLFTFPACMLLCSLLEKLVAWLHERKEKRFRKMQGKVGLLGKYTFTDKLSEPWPDKQFIGLGWQVMSDVHTRAAFLTTPVCAECRSDMLTRTNKKCNGFYLECPDCKKTFDVDDIGQTRAIADASLQGEVRKAPNRFFSAW